MKLYIFLCDQEWTIEKILSCPPQTNLKEDDCLADYLSGGSSRPTTETLKEQRQTMLTMHFSECNQDMLTVICAYPQHFLVFLSDATTPEGFQDFLNQYLKCLTWAKENLELLYDDGYYRIQEINNQLMDFQRELIKSNQQLSNVLQEIRSANNMYAMLEHDDLTGLLTAASFYKKAQELLNHSENPTFHVIAIHLERFKLVNETFGRKAGDELLKNIATFLTGLSGSEHGLLARISGSRFCIFMPAEYNFYHTLQEHLSVFLKNYPLPIQLPARIGVYLTSENSMISIEKMCDRALIAIDSITAGLGTRLAFYNQDLHEKLKLENMILDHVQDALIQQEFLMYLQPKVDLPEGTVVGAEALIRWHHPEMGWITPDKFIPVLEKHGYIYEVDQFIWEEACKVLHFLKEHGKPLFPISVNVARWDLYQSNLLDVLTGLLAKYQLEPEDLRLEILERTYAYDSDSISQVVNRLRNAGFLIEMDDFGVGESSLSMIADMHIDFLKLDRYFLASGLQDKRRVEIIRFIINLAKSLNIKIIAEGVETQEQSDMLLALGCNRVQGYLYGKPIPAKEFLRTYFADVL